MEVKLTEFMYAEPVKGSVMRLYFIDSDGTHHGPIRFTSGDIDQEHKGVLVDVFTASALEMSARERGIETRVTDSGDMLLFHSKDGTILYPKDTSGGDFWGKV